MTHINLHPFEALEDPVFLTSIKLEAAKLKTLVAKELQRKYGQFSAQDEARERTLNDEADLPSDGKLPAGRDWEAEVRVGIHAHPSMSHLHIHVLSVDRFSESMKHRKHYNSFNTPFFIDVEDFPLAKDDIRRHPTGQGYLASDLTCWRCGKGFGNKFRLLKTHLVVEFDKWKRE